MQTAAQKPAIGYFNQVHFGIFLAIGAMLGIEAHSWHPFAIISVFGLFMSLPAFSRFAWTHKTSNWWRVTGWLAAGTFILGILVSVAMFAERLYYVNSKSYVGWLATKDLGEVGAFPFFSEDQIQKLCAHDGIVAIIQKEHGEILLRCNDIAMRPFTHVYIAHMKGAK
ncbi:hypothetical protein [Paraburkholderia youngii]|uniref:hypothetical protein n=1 Tax=Paraburkholderia youngii TaxID=2782701 RepID=UPI003D1DE928